MHYIPSVNWFVNIVAQLLQYVWCSFGWQVRLTWTSGEIVKGQMIRKHISSFKYPVIDQKVVMFCYDCVKCCNKIADEVSFINYINTSERVIFLFGEGMGGYGCGIISYISPSGKPVSFILEQACRLNSQLLDLQFMHGTLETQDLELSASF